MTASAQRAYYKANRDRILANKKVRDKSKQNIVEMDPEKVYFLIDSENNVVYFFRNKKKIKKVPLVCDDCDKVIRAREIGVLYFGMTGDNLREIHYDL